MNRAGPRGALILLVLSLVWFAAMLWSAQANITGTGTAQGALIQLSDALPVVVAASVLAGTAAGLAALGWRPVRAALRWPVAMGAGATPAAVAAVLIIWGYGSRSAILLIATAVLVAGTLGGALGAVRPGELVAAGVAGTLAAFFVAFALRVFENQLLGLFGAGTTPGSQLTAASRLALTTSLLGAAAAGLVAFWYLRRTGPERRFPVYLVAGAFPGVLLLLAEAVTLIGGAQVFHAVSGLSSADRAIVDYVGNSRLNHALILLFVGALVALLCLGRTLRPAEPAKADRTTVS
ncbi:MAG: hypothetical protein E6F99_09365 [Actinobacteria bacterium]|nr:MAG: hypothetical protein E6F99_09365 [Actinomycetota bacterium]